MKTVTAATVEPQERLSALVEQLFSAALWFGLLAIGGAVLTVIGVYLLGGAGLAFLVAGVLSIGAAALIRKGMMNG